MNAILNVILCVLGNRGFCELHCVPVRRKRFHRTLTDAGTKHLDHVAGYLLIRKNIGFHLELNMAINKEFGAMARNSHLVCAKLVFGVVSCSPIVIGERPHLCWFALLPRFELDFRPGHFPRASCFSNETLLECLPELSSVCSRGYS